MHHNVFHTIASTLDRASLWDNLATRAGLRLEPIRSELSSSRSLACGIWFSALAEFKYSHRHTTYVCAYSWLHSSLSLLRCLWCAVVFIAAHSEEINSVNFCADGSMVVSGSSDGLMYVCVYHTNALHTLRHTFSWQRTHNNAYKSQNLKRQLFRLSVETTVPYTKSFLMISGCTIRALFRTLPGMGERLAPLYFVQFLGVWGRGRKFDFCLLVYHQSQMFDPLEYSKLTFHEKMLSVLKTPNSILIPNLASQTKWRFTFCASSALALGLGCYFAGGFTKCS